MPKNFVEETKKRITEMIETKRADLETAQQKEQEARAEIAAATEQIKAATAAMNLEEFEAATNRRNKAKTAASMYAAKAEQIRQQEYVTEEESDRVIDQLLDHEEKLYKDFIDAINGPLEQIRETCSRYIDGVTDTENTIRTWTKDIHANYRSRVTTFKNGTNRGDTPQPVHVAPFTGGPLYHTAREFIEAADRIL